MKKTMPFKVFGNDSDYLMIGAEVLSHMKFMQEKMEHWQFGQIQH